MLLIGTVGLLIGIDVAFAVVTVLVVEAIEKVRFEMLVTVEGSVLPPRYNRKGTLSDMDGISQYPGFLLENQ